MSKCIVKPKKPESYLLPNRESIKPNRPTVVTLTSYLEGLIAAGKLTIYASNLSKDANQNIFLEVLRDSKMDETLAVSSYCAMLGVDIHGQPLTEMEGTLEDEEGPEEGDLEQLSDDHFDPKEND